MTLTKERVKRTFALIICFVVAPLVCIFEERLRKQAKYNNLIDMTLLALCFSVTGASIALLVLLLFGVLFKLELYLLMFYAFQLLFVFWELLPSEEEMRRQEEKQKTGNDLLINEDAPEQDWTIGEDGEIDFFENEESSHLHL